MISTNEPFTFRPPAHRRPLRLVLGLFLSLLAIGGGAFGAAVIWLPRTLSYEVSGTEVTVTSGLAVRPKRMVLPIESITSADAVRLHQGSRRSGTTLPGYCAGHYRFPNLGHCSVASDCSPEAVVLKTDDARPLVITPGQREPFLSAVVGQGRYRETITVTAEGPLWTTLKTMTLIGLLVTLFVPVIFFLSPGRLRYRITSGHVEVDLTFGAKRFSVSRCLARPYTPESASKTIGSSLPGYHSGRFSMDGMATRVYATRLTDGVLIEGPDLRLFINPEDPHAFLEGLRVLGQMDEVHSENPIA